MVTTFWICFKVRTPWKAPGTWVDLGIDHHQMYDVILPKSVLVKHLIDCLYLTSLRPQVSSWCPLCASCINKGAETTERPGRCGRQMVMRILKKKSHVLHCVRWPLHVFHEFEWTQQLQPVRIKHKSCHHRALPACFDTKCKSLNAIGGDWWFCWDLRCWRAPWTRRRQEKLAPKRQLFQLILTKKTHQSMSSYAFFSAFPAYIASKLYHGALDDATRPYLESSILNYDQTRSRFQTTSPAQLLSCSTSQPFDTNFQNSTLINKFLIQTPYTIHRKISRFPTALLSDAQIIATPYITPNLCYND